MMRMQIHELAEQFKRDGFVIIPDFLDAKECAAMNQAVAAHYTAERRSIEAASHQTEAGAFMQAFACDVIPWDPVSEGIACFSAVKNKAILRQITEACIGPAYHESSSLVMYSCTGGRGQSWHQDCLPDAELGFNVNRLFYTRDVREEDGAVVVVPNSHTQGRIPQGGHHESIAGEQIICPKAGSLVLLHGWCFHRVLPNYSGRERVSINYRCFPQGVDASVTGVGVYRNGDAYFRQGLAKMR